MGTIYYLAYNETQYVKKLHIVIVITLDEYIGLCAVRVPWPTGVLSSYGQIFGRDSSSETVNKITKDVMVIVIEMISLNNYIQCNDGLISITYARLCGVLVINAHLITNDLLDFLTPTPQTYRGSSQHFVANS